MFGSGSSSGVGGASYSSSSRSDSFGFSSSNGSFGSSSGASFSSSVSHASSNFSSTPSHRDAERSSMASYSSYSNSGSDRSTRSASSHSSSSRSSYGSGTPSHRDAERSSMDSYRSYRDSGGDRSTPGVSGRSHSPVGSYDTDRSASVSPVTGYDRGGSAPSQRAAEDASMAAYEAYRSERTPTDAYAEYARSRLQAGKPVGGRQLGSYTPSYRQAETESLTALDAYRKDERARTAHEAYRTANQRQAEIDSMQALAEYRIEQAHAKPKSMLDQTVETLGGWPSAAAAGLAGAVNTADHAIAWDARSRSAALATYKNAGNFPVNAAISARLVGKKPAINPANWGSHMQAYQKYGTLSALGRAVKNGDLPAGPNAASSQVLADAVQRNTLTANLGRVARVTGWTAGPVIGGVEGYLSTKVGDSTGTVVAETVTGFAKQIDNTVVAVGAGGFGALFSSPTAPATLGMGPVVVGMATGVTAERTYNAWRVNKKIDHHIESWAPMIAKGIDKGIAFAARGVGRAGQAVYSLNTAIVGLFK